MRYIITPILVGIITLVIFALSKRAARKAEKQIDPNDFIIRTPKTSLIIGIVISVFFFFALGDLAYRGELKERGLISLLAMSLFMAWGPFLIVLWHRWKIVVNVNQITACSYFGKQKTFPFDYITKVEYSLKNTKTGKIEFLAAYHEKEKLFKVTELFAGYKALVSRLENYNKA
jgi:hypothetical protein